VPTHKMLEWPDELYGLDEVNALMQRQQDGKVRYRGVLQIG